ncbi:NAD(P)H-dependent oxidoreductase [Novosphingobium sediminicola]|uniref:NAD(P)H dehydrogenase (Quinone) n=1 Tax=Novosphingobium sediminicola TaxID=563162 RepID=A0A7W6G874_9SPHN|nr:NAD(P)H-dependent oxidoreductase [Novosphingobium sediminicola]MBB3957669.1 NAD(P)H dehydrogenase (quinone) [Novosphingobium sediminicola]
MNILAVYCHPEPQSFTHAMLDVAQEAAARGGHRMDVIDLYARPPAPPAGPGDFAVLSDPAHFHYQTEQRIACEQSTFSTDIAQDQALVAGADILLLLFPLWWGGPPALLKSWFEKVMAYGFAYVDGARFETALFAGKRALCAITTGGTAARFSQDGTYGSIEKVLWPLHHCQLRYLGYAVEAPFVAYAAPRVSPEERGAMLRDLESRLSEVCAGGGGKGLQG